MRRKICVVTGSRAEYGLLRLVMLGIKNDPDLELQIIATGTHLSKDFGMTFKEIESDGFSIDYKVECLSDKDDALSISKASASVINGCADALKELGPDIVLILGDRFEILSCSIAALFARIPIAHIHGGELTLGAFDESIRHALTKISNVHFVTHQDYRRRVIQLGELPDRVIFVGSIVEEIVKSLELLSRDEIEKTLNIKFKKKSLLITFHPVTLDMQSPNDQMRELFSALEDLNDTTLIFTMPNADPGGRAIVALIEDFVQNNSNAYAFASLGQRLYISCMSIVDGVIGNSSSGITEAPVLGKGTVNIGIRQFGRIQTSSVINCAPSRHEIRCAIKALYSKDFIKKQQVVGQREIGIRASQKILKVLKEVDLSQITLKPFFDLSVTFDERLIQ
jgi:GDP/UDP-N,N'-diacetylbacillosamine 2-epimerase (hydrolysing)